jgi:ATP-dependent RNA helicase DeaD
VKNPDASEPSGFASLGLSKTLVSAVGALGYEEPTPIQREAIPVLLAGGDMLGQAGTGTGKTAAFALPLLDRLSRDKAGRGQPRALVLVPTRELAMQVAEALHKYAKGTTLTVTPLYGGAPMDHQVRALRRGADVVVATPGRALDHLRRSTLNLTKRMRCSTWGSPKTSTPSSRRPQTPARRRSSPRRSRRASSASPAGT